MYTIFKNILKLILCIGFCVKTEQNICGGFYTYDHGEISTPNYPNSYPKHWECKWNINVDKNYSILLVFEDFYTFESDYLNVYNKIDDNLSLIGKFSGRNHPKHLISAQNEMFLTFSTTNPRKGFKLWYKTLDSGCGGYHNQNSNIISSPGYPTNYYGNLNCTWTIECQKNRTIILRIKDIHLEDNHAYIEIFNANLKLLANLTSINSLIDLITKSNKLVINFITDNSMNAKDFRGFNISYTTQIVGSHFQFIISATNTIITTHLNQTIDEIYYNSVNEYRIIDYDIDNRKLILFDPKSHEIVFNYFENKRIKINGDFNGMAYDWVHNLFYWIDIQMKNIKVLNTNDNNCNIYSISEVSDENQRDLTINVVKSALVWSQIGLNPKIWQINLDGSDKKVLYSNSRQVFHLTVDYQTKSYYFVDIRDFSLFSIDFNGNNEKYFMTSKLLFGSLIDSSMIFLDNDIYLSNDAFIYKISDFNSRIKSAEILLKCDNHLDIREKQYFNDFKSVDIKRRKIFGFKIFDSKLHPNSTNKCFASECDGLCLPTTKSFRCLRPASVNSSPVIMVSGENNNILPILNIVFIIIIIVSIILIYISLKQMIIKIENRIFQVLVPAVSFRKSKHEYENHDYEEPIFVKK